MNLDVLLKSEEGDLLEFFQSVPRLDGNIIKAALKRIKAHQSASKRIKAARDSAPI